MPSICLTCRDEQAKPLPPACCTISLSLKDMARILYDMVYHRMSRCMKSLYIRDELACIAHLIITKALKHLCSCLLKGARY